MTMKVIVARMRKHTDTPDEVVINNTISVSVSTNIIMSKVN